ERGLVVDGDRAPRRPLLANEVGEPCGPGERRRVGWRAALALGAKDVGALPAVLRAPYRAARGEQVVERARLQRPRRLELVARPAHRVVQAERLAGALGERLLVRRVRTEATDVDIGEVAGRLAADDPFGDQPARASGVGDARRVESGADEEVAQLGRLAEDEVAVGSEAFGAVEEHLDPGRLEARRAA